MNTYSYARWLTITMCALTAACLACCAGRQANQTQKTAMTPQQQQQTKLADLKKQMNDAKAKSDRDSKLIPNLLAQGDVALKQAQDLKEQAAKTKDKKAKKAITDKATKAQAQADAKAQQLIATRRDMYSQLDVVANLQHQIDSFNGQDKAAQKIAASKNKSDRKGKNGQDARSIAAKNKKQNM
jgi:hypothetical protein